MDNENFDNVVQFKSKAQKEAEALDTDFNDKRFNDMLGTVQKAFAARDEDIKKAFAYFNDVTRAMVSDIMNILVNNMAVMDILKDKCGVTDDDLRAAIAKHHEQLGKVNEVMKMNGTTREKFIKAKELGILFSPHFDAVGILSDDTEMTDAEKQELLAELA